MANEYRATLIGAEVVDTGAPTARATLIGAEVLQVDDDATLVKVTAVGAEIAQVDDNATDILVTLVGLEVIRTVGDVAPGTIHFGTVAFAGDLALAFGTPVRTVSGTIRFRGNLSLGFAGQKFPLFECPAPEPKAWARIRPVAKAWSCAVIVAAEECDGITVGANDDLDLVSGDRLVTLDGYGFKLVS